jgi:osmotically inducible lipoprotein OsmB
MRRVAMVLPLAAVFALSACSTPDRTTGERTLTGGAVGAAGGAAAGLITGSFWTGLAAGAVGGATSGFVYDQIEKNRSND